ncbi:MAG TPA: GDP-mannose 4,6-dehydratase [Candidatus Limnocylindria bacterium]|nr:GDP-mannose 4,6-dehydratase [Candidatus Limnocylindria bacterium]
MRVLVTGASGFAGPYLVRALAAHGHEVHGLVRPTGSAASLAGAPVAVHRADVLDAPALGAVFERVRPDAVCHLAALSFVPDAERDPAGAYRVNVDGTLAMLSALRHHAPRARFLYVGSSDAYGAVLSDDLPIDEEVAFRPLTVYGASKAAAELTAAQWGRAYGLDVVRARPFNHTGPGQTPAFVCPALARQIAEVEAGRQPPVLRVGNLDPVRDLSDVRDMAAGYVALLERGLSSHAYNLCSGVGRSIREVVDVFRSLARVPIDVAQDPALTRRVEVPSLIGSAERALADTGWRPLIPFEQTAADLLAWWRSREP